MEISGNIGSEHLPRFGMKLPLNEASQEPVVITDLSEGSGRRNPMPALGVQPMVLFSYTSISGAGPHRLSKFSSMGGAFATISRVGVR